MTNKSPDCYKCKYRGSVPGSAHSCCNHPAFSKIKDDPRLQMLSILSCAQGVPGLEIHSYDCVVIGNPYGIRKGWFNHPFNFDPVWLIECSGYEAKDEKDA